jgi:hypothetical protein
MKLLNGMNFFNPLWIMDNYLTFWGGDPEPQQQTTTSGIDPSMRPYVEKGLSEAQRLYETYTPKYFEG